MLTPNGQQTRQDHFAHEVFWGEGASARRLRLQVTRIAPHFRSTLLVGAAGCGKQAVAQALHRMGADAGALLVSDLEQALDTGEPENGTAYLHGLERLGTALQGELARRIARVDRSYRLILGSECEPRGIMAAGRMSSELAAAMEMPVIRIAALRERGGEIGDIAAAMLEEAGASFTPAALAALRSYHWPGNLTELRQVCAKVARPGAVIGVEELPLLGCAAGDAPLRLNEVIARHVRDVLQRCAGNKLKAAELLGISRSTLYRMLQA